MKKKGYTYCISDIHNDYRSFCAMCKEISFSDSDQMYIIGDIFDRGLNPEPVGLYHEISKASNIFPIMGNHDKWLLEYLIEYLEGKSTAYSMPYRYNTFGILKQQLTRDEMYQLAVWIDQMPLQIDIEDGNGKKYLLAHAQTFLPVDKVADESAYLMGRFLNQEYLLNGLGEYISVIGHYNSDILYQWLDENRTAIDAMVIFSNSKQNVFGTDCGNAYRGIDRRGRLGCLRLEDKYCFYV